MIKINKLPKTWEGAGVRIWHPLSLYITAPAALQTARPPQERSTKRGGGYVFDEVFAAANATRDPYRGGSRNRRISAGSAEEYYTTPRTAKYIAEKLTKYCFCGIMRSKSKMFFMNFTRILCWLFSNGAHTYLHNAPRFVHTLYKKRVRLREDL